MRVWVVTEEKYCPHCSNGWINLDFNMEIDISNLICQRHLNNVKRVICQTMLGTSLNTFWWIKDYNTIVFEISNEIQQESLLYVFDLEL